MWLAEMNLKTKMGLFLPTYPEEFLMEIENTPESILKKFNKLWRVE